MGREGCVVAGKSRPCGLKKKCGGDCPRHICRLSKAKRAGLIRAIRLPADGANAVQPTADKNQGVEG